MLSADIHQLIATLPPGSKVFVVTVELPLVLGNEGTHTARPESRVDTVGSSTVGGVTSWSPPSTRGEPDVNARVSAMKRKHGGDSVFKPREWSPVVDLSEREIERAISHGAVTASEKGDGRDHAALVVSVDAMESYLATVDAVTKGKMDPPRWWDLVRVGGKRNSLVGR